MDPRGWTFADFAAAYRSGIRVSDVIGATLQSLRDAPKGILIGEPLWDAMLDAARLDAAQRDAAHAELDRPGSLPLFGLPFLVKDNIDIAGVVTTAGCPGFAAVASSDATIVSLLRSAGAVPVGKANLDQFATGLVGTRSPYGVPTNVLDPTLVPGGSSSGSAVAVASGLVPFAIGTDTAGSGRVPAALNGIVGLKPTRGSASTSGIIPAVRRLDCPSVFARNVADAVSVAEIIRRPDAQDPASRVAQQRAPFRSPPVVGAPAAWPTTVEISDQMIGWFDSAVGRLEDLGCTVVGVDINPLLAIGSMLYGTSLVAERTVVAGEAVEKGFKGLDPVVAEIIDRGHTYTAVDAYRTEYELARLRAASASLWEDIDVLALPTTPAVASVEAVRDDPFGPNEMLGRLTTFVNLLDLMSVVVPIRHEGRRVPAGLQLIGAAWSDTSVERLARAVDEGAMSPFHQTCSLVVVGAHLEGLALHHQLTERRATLISRSQTAPDYRLFALADVVPPKPGLVRVATGTGAAVDVEVWSMGETQFGSFVAQVPAPLCIGRVELADGTVHSGFLCEQAGLDGAIDITHFGGWKAYIAATLAP